MADAPGPGGAKDPHAAIQKYATASGADPAASQDAAIIARVEKQLQTGGLLGWLRGISSETESKASSERSQVDSKVNEHKDLVAKNQKDAPKDAGNPPPLGPATRPVVPSAKGVADKGGAPSPKSAGAGKEGPAGKANVAPPAGGKGAAASQQQAPLSAQLAGATSDAQIDGILNAYQPKGQQSTEVLSRIKQMGDVAKGFDGQIGVYVAQGGAVEHAIAGAANFFGMGKSVAAVWAQNPYRKMHGVLGNIMTGLSAIKTVCSLVGSICGKLGLILTVVGLLGMIFPPIGAAVSGIARVLNVVGLICDAIAFVIAGILTGLNGVILARQIAAGASAEEKAATADLMIGEANDAASGFVNMAMIFGPKFMKGLLGSSKGIISSLIKRMKASVGRIKFNITANVKHFANRIARRMGVGVKVTRVNGAWKSTSVLQRSKDAIANSRVGKAFNSAPKAIDSIQNKLMAKYGNTAWAKKLDRIGATSGAFANKIDLEKKIGGWGESSGKWVGNIGAETKFGKGMAAAADKAERDTREAIMKAQMRDAVHLEEQRWKNYLKDRQRQNPDHIRNKNAEQEFVKRQGNKVRDKHVADFQTSENKLAHAERLEAMKKARAERHNRELTENSVGYSGKGSRDEFMDRVHDTRARRFELEDQFRVQETERKALLDKTKRTAEEEARLTALNTELKDLDHARKLSTTYEGEMNSIAGYSRKPRNNWKDVGSNVWEASSPLLEMLHLKEQDAWWKGVEAYNFRKPLQFDKGAAKGNAAGRGGQGTFAEIKNAPTHAARHDFHEFVRSQVRTSTVAETARSRLAGLNAPVAPTTSATQPRSSSLPSMSMPSMSSAPTAAPQSAAPQPAAAQTSTAPGASPQVSVSPPQAASPAPAQAPAATTAPAPAAATQPTAAPQPANEPQGDTGGEALPYWPALIPEFDKAMGDFGYIRKVAVEFRKAQIEGKQKAVDTLAVYGRYEEYAKLRADAAVQNQTAAAGTKADTQANAGQAGQSATQAGTGEQKQGEARGAANDRAAVDLPEPESRGFWDRILGAVKRWAKNKAAQIFGWIQEKIASVVLKGLCGVSMGDMKLYASALRNQQMRAGGVADTAGKQSGQAQQKQIKLSKDASKEAQGAADAIAECDHNIVEADVFMQDITAFEHQLAEEKAHAQAFIAQIYAATHAERERRRVEQEQEAAQAAQQQSMLGGDDEANMCQDDPATVDPDERTGADAGPSMSMPTASDPDAAHEAIDADAAAEAQAGTLKATAQYVAGAGDLLVTQLSTKADDYRNQYIIALTNRTGRDEDGNRLVRGGETSVWISDPAREGAKEIINDFKRSVDETKQDMQQFDNLAPQIRANPSSAQQIANAIIKSAEHLDKEFAESQQQLDNLFERTYAAVREGEHTLRSRILDGDNPIGKVNDVGTDIDRTVYETAAPVADHAADTLLTPFQGPAAPPPPPAPDAGTTTEPTDTP